MERGNVVGKQRLAAVCIVLVLLSPAFVTVAAVRIPDAPTGPHLAKARGLMVTDPRGDEYGPVAIANSHARSGSDYSRAAGHFGLYAGTSAAAVLAEAKSEVLTKTTRASSQVTGLTVLGSVVTAAQVGATVTFLPNGSWTLQGSGVQGLSVLGTPLGSFRQSAEIEVGGVLVRILETSQEAAGCVRVKGLQVITSDGWKVVAGDSTACPSPAAEPRTRGSAFAEGGVEGTTLPLSPYSDTVGVRAVLTWKGEAQSESHIIAPLPLGGHSNVSIVEERAIIGRDVYAKAHVTVEPFSIPDVLELAARVEGDAYAHSNRTSSDSTAVLDQIRLFAGGEQLIVDSADPVTVNLLSDPRDPTTEYGFVHIGEAFNTAGADPSTGENVATATIDVMQIVLHGDRLPAPVPGDVRIRLGFAYVEARAPGIPNMTLKAVATPAITRAGLPVTFDYRVSNTGAAPVDDLRLTDSRAGNVPGCALHSLAYRQFVACSQTRVVDDLDDGGVPATASGFGPEGEPVSASAVAALEIIHPSLDVDVEASPARVHEGEETTFSFTVSNTGDSPLVDVEVDDVTLGLIGSVPSILPGESATLFATASPTVTHLYASRGRGLDETGLPVSDDDTTIVTLIHPAIGVLVDAPSIVHLAEPLAVSYAVLNLGDVPLYSISLRDPFTGASFVVDELPVGAIVPFETSTTAPDASFLLAPHALGQDDTGFEVEARAERAVRVIDSGMALAMGATPAIIRDGGEVVWDYAMTNTGDNQIVEMTLSDRSAGVLVDGLALGPAESVTLERSETATVDTTATADVVGIDEAGSPVAASDSAAVRVIHPSLWVRSEPSASAVRGGSDVTITYTIANLGDAVVDGIAVEDDVFGHVGDVTSLPVGGSATFTIERAVTADIEGVATAGGLDELGLPVEASGTYAIDVQNPSISLLKRADAESVTRGSDVTYEFIATNDGDADLEMIRVDDDHVGAVGAVERLAPGESVVFTVTLPLTATTQNVAIATAGDGLGGFVSSTDTALVVVVELPPVADFTFAPSSTTPGVPVSFTDRSSDPDGTIVAWYWDFGDAGTAAEPDPVHSYASTGEYLVTLVVTDNDGHSAAASSTLTVDEVPPPPNAPPTAAFSSSPGTGEVGSGVLFTDESSDPDGTIVSWQWDFGDGSTSFDPDPTHVFAAAGEYTVTLTVTDDQGSSASTSKTIGIVSPPPPPNAAPLADFDASPTPATTGVPVDFTDLSADSDGIIVSWSWDFGDGASSAAEDPTHAYASSGTFIVTLTVMDDDGATASASQTVTVEEPAPAPNVPPIADFTASPQSAIVGASISFSDMSSDTDGTIVSWQWDFGDGVTSGEMDPTHAFSLPGSFTVTLTVTDDDGASATTSRVVSITNEDDDTCDVSEECGGPLPTEPIDWSGNAPTSTVSILGKGATTIKAGERKGLSVVLTNSGINSRIYGLAVSFAQQAPERVALDPEAPAAVRLTAGDGRVLFEGPVSPRSSTGPFARFDATGEHVYEMETFRLPPEVYLEPGGRLEVTVEIVGGNAPGTGRIVAFLPSTTDAAGDAEARAWDGLNDFTNMFPSRGGWYPLHNSFVGWDDGLSSGRVWKQYSWQPKLTLDAFSKVDLAVTRK
ncbi:MAG: PKD domain-containing protein [Euryarchaeota archaeon]|nr:PKD domain-containing protein [Euryarchaeota archaeon]